MFLSIDRRRERNSVHLGRTEGLQMDPPIHRSSRSSREPAAPVKRIESQAVLGPKLPHSGGATAKSNVRPTQEQSKGSDDSASDSSSKRGGDSGSGPSTPLQQSFQTIRSTVAENRRREHRTPSTAPTPIISTIRKAQYLKNKTGRVASASPTRACTRIVSSNCLSLAMMYSPSTFISGGPRATSVRHKHTCVAIGGDEILLYYGGCTNAGTAPTQTILTYHIASRVWNTPVPRKRAGPVEEFSLRRVSTQSHHDAEDEMSASSDDRSEYVPMREVPLMMENRFAHTAVYWGGIMWIFGGQTSTTGTSSVISNTMLAYSVEKNEWWNVLPDTNGPLPQPRRGHAAIVFGESMFIFGGCGPNAEPFNDMWMYNFKDNTWMKVIAVSGTLPSPRFSHACEVIGNHLFLFGGFDGVKENNEFFSFNLNTFKWSAIELSGETPVKPPAKHSARLCAYDDRLVLIGGTSALDDYTLDVYVYHTKKAAWYIQRYDMEEAIKNDGNPSSIYGANHGTSGAAAQDSMAARYTRTESSLMTVDKRNRVYHTATIIASNIQSPRAIAYTGQTIPDVNTMANRCEIYVFGGVNGHLANVLDVLDIEFSETPDAEDVDQTSLLNLMPMEQWEAAAMNYNPEVLALCERLRMLTGEPSFARDPANSARSQATATFGNHDVLMLVMEWLTLNGYRATLQRLIKDTHQQFVKQYDTRASALESLLSFARRRVKRGTSMWDDQVLSVVSSSGIVQAIDHLPDWYQSQSREVIVSQNPWDEAISDDNLRVDPETHRILFATLNALVILTLDYANFANPLATQEEIDDYVACFFHTYHSFTTPLVLLEKFIQLFELSENALLPEDVVTAHRTRILDLILVWIDLASWDWTNEYLTLKLKDFVDGPLVNTDLRYMAPQIKQALAIAIDFSNSPAAGTSASAVIANTGKVKSQSITTSQLMSMNPLPGTQRLRSMIVEQLVDPPDPVVRKSIFSSHHTLDDVHELELARQLTIMQFSLFCMIKPSEWLNGWWKSEDAEYRAPHLRVCLNRASVITDWVVASITRPGDDKKARGRTVERFFKVAEQLRALNNLETLAAILAGLRQAPEDLIERVEKRNLDALYKLDTSISTHNDVIDNLDVLTPCIPNLKLVLKQIGQIEDQAELLVVPPCKNGRPLINMHKCRSLYAILRRTVTLQARFYNLLPVYQIISPLRAPGSPISDASTTASLRIMLSPRVQ